jgi:hypothetical protein
MMRIEPGGGDGSSCAGFGGSGSDIHSLISGRRLLVLSIHYFAIALAMLMLSSLAAAAISPATTEPSGIPADYAVARDRLAAEGRHATELVIAGNSHDLAKLVAPQVAGQLSETVLATAIENDRKQGAIGPTDVESILPIEPEQGMYVSEHNWDNRRLRIKTVWNSNGQIIGLWLLPARSLPTDVHADAAPVKLHLPFDGIWWVVWGGNEEIVNYHVIAPDQRHAMDILVWQNGSTHRGDGTACDQYYAWGRPVLSPADAVVTEAIDGLRDNQPRVQMDRQHLAGNHVILQVAPNQYVLIAHMQQGSVKVKTGDHVTVGQPLGLCGNSGNTSEPHVHIHVQDGPTLFKAKGLPLAFVDIDVDGKPVAVAEPVQGQFISPAASLK